MTAISSASAAPEYPLFDVKNKADVDAVLAADPEQRKFHLSTEHPRYHRSAAMYLFRQGQCDLAEYVVSQGGKFEAEEHLGSIGDGFYCKLPNIHRHVLEAHWKRAKQYHLEIQILQMILEKSCKHFQRDSFLWAIDKLNEAQMPYDKINRFNLLKIIATYGWDEILNHPIWEEMRFLNDKQKKELSDLALEKGHPEVAEILLGKKTKKTEDLARALGQGDAVAPGAINALHAQLHGGQDNEAIYQREYARGVAYAYHMMGKDDCNFYELINHLANHRRRMAALGNLVNQDNFGKKSKFPTFTPFEPAYAEFGELVREKYGPNLARQAKANIGGKVLELTIIKPDGWQIPPDHVEPVLRETVRYCNLLRSGIGQELGAGAYLEKRLLGGLIWTLAQAPFSRGTPTIMYMLVDALCQHLGRPSFTKMKPDLNCMALVYDNRDEFIDWFVQQGN